MSGTLTTDSGFAAHVHEIIELDDQGASPGVVEGFIELMSVGVEEQAALRVLASSLHTGAGVNQVITGVHPSTARMVDGELETRQSKDRWVNEGGSTGRAARVPARLHSSGMPDEKADRDVGQSKWSWHEDRRGHA